MIENEKVEPRQKEASMTEHAPLAHIKVLCVDNETDILLGMRTLMERWGCEVKTATNLVESIRLIEGDWKPQVIFSNYRLDHDRTGLEVLQQCRLRLGDRFEGVIISADKTEEMLRTLKSNGSSFIPKPVKPIKIRAVLNQIR